MMKRLPVLLLAVVLAVALFAFLAYAQQGGGGRRGPMMGGPPEVEGMEPPQMGWGRMGQPAIAVSDGFIYVVSGGTLLQYDQRLNLVNSVELPGAARGMGPGPEAGAGGRGGGGGGGRMGGGGGGGGGRGGGGRGMRGGAEE